MTELFTIPPGLDGKLYGRMCHLFIYLYLWYVCLCAISTRGAPDRAYTTELVDIY